MVNIIILAGENCTFRKPLARFPLKVRNIGVNVENEVFNSVTTMHTRRKIDPSASVHLLQLTSKRYCAKAAFSGLLIRQWFSVR